MGVKRYFHKGKGNIKSTTIDDRYSIEEYDYQEGRLYNAVNKNKVPVMFVIGQVRYKKDPGLDPEITMLGV